MELAMIAYDQRNSIEDFGLLWIVLGVQLSSN